MEDIIIKTTLKIEIYKNKNNYEVEKEHNNLFIKNINFKNVDPKRSDFLFLTLFLRHNYI